MSIGIPIVDAIFNIIKGGQERGLEEIKIRADLEKTLQGYITQEIAAVNASMQAEARSDKWMQWAWRPIVGFTFSLVVLNNYVIMPYFQQVKPIIIPDQLWLAMLAILGVASYTRGMEKVKRIEHLPTAPREESPVRGGSATLTEAMDRGTRR